jgi:hypothetical protein
VSLIIADARDGGTQVCVMMVAGVRNAGEPGALERQGGRAGAGVTTGVFCVVMAAVMDMFRAKGGDHVHSYSPLLL